MSNNSVLPATGEIYSSDEVENAAGEDINFQIIKLGHSDAGEEPRQVSTGDPLPITSSRMEGLLEKILIELRITNKYNELGHDEIIEEDSIHEDRRR